MTDASHRPGNIPAAHVRLPPLYPIVDIDLCRMRGIDPVALGRAFVAGGARLLQVRQKGRGAGSGALLTTTRDLVAAVRPEGARVIVNDRADLAVMAAADGVHVGQEDLPVASVRALAGPAAMVGISTHTLEQIDEAAKGTADYIAVGPVFSTTTKDTGYEARGLDMVRYAASKGKPVVAIGGITEDNARDVLAAGAASVAVISCLLSGGSPEVKVRDFLEKLRF